MPGQPPPDGPDDRTVLHALPEDQPDSLGVGTTSNQADLDGGPTDKTDGDGVPAKSAPKPEWESYAQSHGVDTDGMTKDEIRDAVNS